MNRPLLLIPALSAALVLGACERAPPTVVNVPAASPVAVPGPAGPPGATGNPGSDGKPGEGSTTVIVVPPASAPSN